MWLCFVICFVDVNVCRRYTRALIESQNLAKRFRPLAWEWERVWCSVSGNLDGIENKGSLVRLFAVELDASVCVPSRGSSILTVAGRWGAS